MCVWVCVFTTCMYVCGTGPSSVSENIMCNAWFKDHSWKDEIGNTNIIAKEGDILEKVEHYRHTKQIHKD